ncbi:SH3 domain-binding protein 5 -like protein [Sarcoptes scabiei]|nr:SH3 domain-binding protein 5 -like protein [Sarcoptes scabiei]
MSSNTAKFHQNYEDDPYESHFIQDEFNDLECFPEIKEFDSKIQELLDDLNSYSTKINELEKMFQEENSRFQRVLSENSIKLKEITKLCGAKHIDISRPYYDALLKINNLKNQCQKTVLQFEKYNKLYLDAKQAIADVEANDDNQFDQLKQEKLNIANLKFSEVNKKRQELEIEHLGMMAQIRITEYTASQLKEKHKNSIRKSKIYFNESDNFRSKLASIKDCIQKLKQEIGDCKNHYSKTLKNLGEISEEIHERRSQLLSKSLKREPGVGAEIIENNIPEELSSLKINTDDVVK